MAACCFTGHRPKYFRFGTDETHPECLQIKAFLRQECERLIDSHDVTHFMSGGAVGVDTWAMEEVLALRQNHPHITLECILPYAGMPGRFAPRDRERYARIQPHLHRVTALNERYHSGCMMERNRYMVDRSQFVIAVWTGKRSGTANTVRYAKQHGRTVICMKIA